MKFNSCDELFKIPEIPLGFHAPKTSSPINKIQDSSRALTSFSQTFFAGATNYNENVLNKSIRRSSRISEKLQNEQSRYNDESVVSNGNQSLRRSSRKSVLQMYQSKRQSVRLAAHNNQNHLTEERVETVEATKTVRKLNKSINKKNSINNIIDGYLNGSTSASTKISLSKHRKGILDLLNKGSMKELKLLPYVGQKTAYLIVTQR